MKILSVVSFFLSQINPLTKNEKNVILTPISHGFQGIHVNHLHVILDQFEITGSYRVNGPGISDLILP